LLKCASELYHTLNHHHYQYHHHTHEPASIRQRQPTMTWAARTWHTPCSRWLQSPGSQGGRNIHRLHSSNNHNATHITTKYH